MTVASTIKDPVSGAKVWRLDSFVNHVSPEIDWLVDDLLPMGGLSMLVAKPKVGKSTLARCLAAAISGSRDTWMGRKIITGRVLHLALEEGPRTIRGHYVEIAEASGLDMERIHIFNDPPHLLKPDPIEALDRYIDLFMPDLIIIDPLFRFLRMPEGNEYGQVSEKMQPLIDLAHLSTPHILAIHHAGKTRGRERGDEILGSTALGGSVDVSLSLQMDGNQRSLSAYGRDIEDFPATILHMDSNRWIEPMGTKAEARAKIRSEVLRESIITYLDGCSGRWQTIGQIQKGVGKKRQDVIQQLLYLTRLGDIEQRGDGLPGSPHEYKI